MSQPPKTRSSSEASGRKSRMRGALASVRLPRRMVPICVSEPTGSASPLRASRTPAIIVVATAPSPGISTPSFPSAGSIRSGRLMLFGIEQKVGQQFAIGENGVIDEIAVLRPRGWSTHDRGLLAARVAGEFPSVHVRCEDGDGGDGGVAHVRASEWRRGDFDHWRFDERVDALADATL